MALLAAAQFPEGVRAVAEKGPTAGYPVIDFKAVLVDGSFHTVDSDELSFRLAGAMATRKGIAEARPILLEPIMEVEVRVPEAYMGEVNRDLNTRRGRLLGMDAREGQQILSAHVPQAELFTYATELRSITGGRGTFSAKLAQYEEVPSHVAQQVIADWQHEYNHYRPHSSLEYKTPATFAEQQKMANKPTDLPAKKEPAIVSI